jgi:RHS repeat-associated protein
MKYGFGAFGSITNNLLTPLSPACANPELVYFTGQNKTGQQKIINTTERSYTGSSYVETIQNFVYDNYLQQSEMTTLSSKGETLKTTFTYPYDYTVSPYTTMLNNNFITPVIEETSSLDNVQTFWKSTDYDIFSNHYLPQKIRTKVGAGTEITPIVFDTYNPRGNLTKYTLRSGQTTTLDWYGTTGTDIGKTDLLKSQTVGGGSTGLVLARSMSYDYFSLVGVKTITDYNGYTTNYNFDDFQRLLNIKDDKGNLLKDFRYHYANQANPTGIGVNANSELNFVLSRTARTEQTGTELSNSVDLSSTQLQYLDGLGRELQTLLWRASPDKTKDILTSTTVYDVFGRAYKGILPTSSDEALGVYKSNAQTLAGTFYGGDTYPFTESVFEPSPLNRPLKQFGAGQAWRVLNNEKFVSMEYNVGGTEVWQFNIQSDGSVKGEITYPANSLYSNLTTSERGFWTKELKDKQGRVIAKMQQLNTVDVATTAYCYNDLTGNLAYVIPPEAYKKFGTGTGQITSFQESDEIFKELCFGYHFDSKNRQNEKHVPGGGWRYSVFDKHDREVMFADDADKAKGYWQFRKFDALSREIQNGILNGKGSTSRATLQTAFDGHSGDSFEVVTPPSGAGGLLGYTNVSFPTGYVPVDADIMSVSYFDNYDWQTESAYNFNASTAFHTQGLAKGLMTGMLSRNIETNDWLKTVNYFDYRGKLIQSFFKNHKGNIERSETQYQFNGDVLKMNIDHEGNTETYDYEIDHMSRKKSFKHTLNGILKNVSQYQYDELGRLKTKKLSPFTTLGTSASGSWNNTNTWQNNGLPSINDYIKINAGHTVTINAGEAGSAGNLFNEGTLNTLGQLKLGVLPPNTSGVAELQSVDYSYHIRGLRGINLDASGNLTDKLFSMKLSYETEGFFDGNIGKQEWKSSLDNVTRSFTYGYDGGSRIKFGIYESTKAGENYSLNNVNYDSNGNITNLSRNGWKSNNTFGLVDNLNYTYNANSNKIQKVDDGANDTASFADVAGNDYTYSLDGSLTSDANKGISVIEYNYLKRPRRIVKNGVEILYQYSASGVKLRETIGSNFTDYLGNIIKKNNVLYQISHDEGRVVNGIYEYNITDHLGNLRVAFKDSLGIAKIVQSNAYGVWGEDLPTLKYLNTPKINNFGYLNREFQPETGYTDLVNRQFDNIVGRFTSIDPVTDGQEHLSLYQYGWNNPILKSDPNGQMPCCGDFLNGVGTGFVDTFKSIGNAIAHPINTVSTAIQNNAAALKADPVGASLNQAINSVPGLSGVKETIDIGASLIRGDNNGAGKIVGGQLAQATIALATEGAGRVLSSGAKSVAGLETNVIPTVQRGRLGNISTRNQIDNIATNLESRGYEITGGGGRVAEEYLKPVGGAKTGGSYPDITATKNGRTIRINTVDTRVDGVTPSTREATNAARIRQQTPGDHLILIPKQ